MACARAVGHERRLVLSDRSPEQVVTAVASLRSDGFDAEGVVADITSVDDLGRLAAAAAPIATAVVTAGLSPVQAPAESILAVDLVGAAQAIDVFLPYLVRGGSLTIIASMAGYAVPFTAADERALALTATNELIATSIATSVATSSEFAYVVAKRGVQMRVRAAAQAYGSRGVRINSISPGVIETSMGEQELASSSGDAMRMMLGLAPVARIGRPEDIADAAAFLASAAASYITGVDLLVDGGVTPTVAFHSPHGRSA